MLPGFYPEILGSVWSLPVLYETPNSSPQPFRRGRAFGRWGPCARGLGSAETTRDLAPKGVVKLEEP